MAKTTAFGSHSISIETSKHKRSLVNSFAGLSQHGISKELEMLKLLCSKSCSLATSANSSL
eukprot:799601-Amphidinium_carterae.1